MIMNCNSFFKPIEVFAEKFFEGWQKMTSNGYDDGVLVDGPESGWLGHYSLMKKLEKKVELFWLQHFNKLQIYN